MRKKYIPNIFTFTNMLLGLLSILLLVQIEHPHKTIIVPAMILLGGIADFFDGFIARKLNVVTDFSKQLDSFADIITFGVAPIALINYLCSCNYKFFSITASIIYIAASAYRLARYNLNNFKDHFVGLPITAAGILLTIYAFAYPFWAYNTNRLQSTIITALFLLLLSALMVSKAKVKRIFRSKSG